MREKHHGGLIFALFHFDSKREQTQLPAALFALLTGVVLDQFRQGLEGVGGGDVVSTFIKAADLVVLHHVPFAFAHAVSD